MAMHFDAEQTEAINTKDTSILVSASAGAGKTGVLVARLMKRCVADRIPYPVDPGCHLYRSRRWRK